MIIAECILTNLIMNCSILNILDISDLSKKKTIYFTEEYGILLV